MKMMQQKQMQPQRAKLSPARALQGASLTDAPLKPESLAEGLKRASCRKADADDDAEALKQERKQGASIFKGLSDDDAADEALKPCKHDAAGKQIQMMMHPCRLEALQAPKAGCKALEALAGLMMQMMQQERTYKQERTRYTRYTKSQKSQNIINPSCYTTLKKSSVMDTNMNYFDILKLQKAGVKIFKIVNGVVITCNCQKGEPYKGVLGHKTVGGYTVHQDGAKSNFFQFWDQAVVFAHFWSKSHNNREAWASTCDWFAQPHKALTGRAIPFEWNPAAL